jgi:hypothetical protein
MMEFHIIDTSVLCVWLGVPRMETCGAGDTAWDQKKARASIDPEAAEALGILYVIPLAVIVETGNHIALAKGRPTEKGKAVREFQQLLENLATETSPWAPFIDQTSLWTPQHLMALAEQWPILAERGIGIGDATILDVARAYSLRGKVEVYTGDAELKKQVPEVTVSPRAARRSRRRRR